MSHSMDTTSQGSEKPIALDSLSVDQLQDLHEVIKEPLEGRQVMVPLRSKAFVIGALRPDKNRNGDEQLLVRQNVDGVDLKAMSRVEAGKMLEGKIATKTMEKDAKRSATTAFKKNKPSNKSKTSEKQKPQPQNSTASSEEKSNKEPPPAGNNDLPFFEIKEEYDDAGNELRSETVNMTKPLILVSNNLETNTLQETKDDNLHEGDNDFDQALTIEVEQVKTPIKDEKYDALSARLEELARLEEEAEEKAKLNRKSAKKLQSKGWSRGFFKSGTSKPEKGTKITPQKSANVSAPIPTKQALKQKDGWSSGFLNKPSKQHQKAKGEKGTQSEAESTKKVSFDGNNEICEIPRVGQNSVLALKKPLSRPIVSSDDLPASDSGGRGVARPFDASVFSGVVKERTVSSTKVSSSSSSMKTEQPKKKLSRFAQERQQQR